MTLLEMTTPPERPARSYEPVGTRADDEPDEGAPPHSLLCPECGRPVQHGEHFCRGCGTAVGWLGDAVEDGTVEQAFRLRRCACCNRRPKLPGRFCTACGEVTLCGRCGTYRREATRFCRGCGLDLGALRFAPPPSGEVGSFQYRSVDVEYEFNAPPDKLALDLRRFGEMRSVDPTRLEAAVALVDCIAGLARAGAASLRVDFKGYRQVRATTVPWFRGPPIALARHPWLEATAPFFEGTNLRLILVTSVREETLIVPDGKKQRPRRTRVEQVTDLVLFTLKLPEGRTLEPGDEEYLRRKLADDAHRLRRASLRPDAATLEFDFGPAHILKSSRRDRTHTGFNVDRLIWKEPLVKVVEASYKALLDAADQHAF